MKSPSCKEMYTAFFSTLRSKMQNKDDEKLEACVQEFKNFIENEPTIFAVCNMMIDQAKKRFEEVCQGGYLHFKDYHEMCSFINTTIQCAPPYNDNEFDAVPFNVVLNFTMMTPAGYSFYTSEKVNMYLGRILRHWGDYLSSAESLVAFKPIEEGGCGWTSPEALEKLDMDQFEQPDASAPGWGYKSWNDWFIRKFKVGQRSVASPEDSGIIVSACESTPIAVEKDAQLRSQFWVKQQPYSLSFMLGGDEIAEPFVGGEIYQAFLSPFNYHRWHSPISGVITHATVIPGTFYACCPGADFDVPGLRLSQKFLANVAARAVFKIKADNSKIGEMALVAVGMSDVSSLIVTASVGQHLSKGDELGYFQFGGSTHCLIFKKGVIGSWFENTTTECVVKLGTAIATV